MVRKPNDKMRWEAPKIVMQGSLRKTTQSFSPSSPLSVFSLGPASPPSDHDDRHHSHS